MQAQHVRHVTGERQHQDRELHQHAIHEHPHRLHIRRDAVDDRTAGVRVVKAEVEPLQFVVDRRSQVDHNPLMHQHAGRHRVTVIQAGTHERDAQNRERHHADLSQRRPVGRQRPTTRPTRRRVLFPQMKADRVDPDPAQLQRHERRAEQQDLQQQQRRAAASITPTEREQTPQHSAGGQFGA